MLRRQPVLLLLSSLLASWPLAAQNPWTRVPPFPSQCYQDRDTFNADLEAARTAIQQDIERQGAINQALKERMDNLPDTTKQRKMTVFLTANPQRAQQVLGAMSSQSAAVQATVENDRMPSLQAEYKRLEADQHAEDEAVLGPLFQEWVRVTRSGSNASEAQAAAAAGAYNAAYEGVCRKSIVAGRFPDFLKKYRTYMVNEWLPASQQPALSTKAMYGIFGIDARDYQSTTEMEEVLKYTNYVGWAFGRRREKPLAP